MATHRDIIAAKNLLRPFFNAKRPSSYWKPMQSLRQLASPSTYADLCKIAEDSKHYPFQGLGNTFPIKPHEIASPRVRRLMPLSEAREVGLQISRARHHADRLTAALKHLSDINTCLAAASWSRSTDDLIDKHRQKFGISLTLLRKELYASVLSDGLSGLTRDVRAITESTQRTPWSIYCHHLYDILDPACEPAYTIRFWLRRMSARDANDSWFTSLLIDSLTGVNNSPADRAEAILRLSTSSILDTLLFMWRHGRTPLHPYFGAIQTLPSNLLDVLNDCFSYIKVTPPEIYKTPDGALADFEIFRLSFIFSDIGSVVDWRSSFNNLVLFDSKYIKNVEDVWYAERNVEISSSDLRPSLIDASVRHNDKWLTSWLRHTSSVEPALLHASFLAAALRVNSSTLLSDRNALAEAISSADHIHNYIEKDILSGLMSNNDEEPDILDFVAKNMLYLQSRSRDNDLERRLTIMNIVIESNCGSLPSYLISISQKYPKTADQVARSCTRLFLEKLFLIMHSLKDVITSRIEICQWMLTRESVDVDSVNVEIDSLRRELQNLDARSDLDSTRIHVDEDSLREWFIETQKSSVLRYIQTVVAEGHARRPDSLLHFLIQRERSEDEIGIDTHIGSEHLLLDLFVHTLRAFASDRSFGLDAYLSRRIRHGTLIGYVMTPLNRSIKRVEDNVSVGHVLLANGATIRETTDRWMQAVSAELDDARRHVIQLNGKDQPRGLIRADWRTGNNIQHLDAAIARIRRRVLDTNGAYDIFGDLYALCWACIEIDLAQLRRYLLRDVFPKLNLLLSESYSQLDVQDQGLIYPYISDFQPVLRSKIQEVCGWFIRPVFRQDSYSLRRLVTSTISIVKELDDKYGLSETVSVSDEITLDRSSFDIFGDILFVLVGNAAKHGRLDGEINVYAEVANSGTSDEQIIMIEVQSYVGDEASHESAVVRIQDAMAGTNEADLSKAAVGEGFSGLRKAVGIINHLRTGTAAFAFYADVTKLDIRFAVYLSSRKFSRSVSV